MQTLSLFTTQEPSERDVNLTSHSPNTFYSTLTQGDGPNESCLIPLCASPKQGHRVARGDDLDFDRSETSIWPDQTNTPRVAVNDQPDETCAVEYPQRCVNRRRLKLQNGDNFRRVRYLWDRFLPPGATDHNRQQTTLSYRPPKKARNYYFRVTVKLPYMGPAKQQSLAPASRWIRLFSLGGPHARCAFWLRWL